ncbi:hypothetical protein V6N13_000740 [Hibiscus sabdariffa]
MKRLAYAKVCVEVSINSSIPQFVNVILHNDKTCYVEPIGSGKTVAVDHGKVVAPGGIRGSCIQYTVLTDVTEAVVVASTIASVGDVTGSNVVGVGINPSASTAVDVASIDVGVISTDIEVVVNAVHVADTAPDVVDNQIVVNEFVGGEREVVASSLVDIQVVVGGMNVLVEDPILSPRNAFHGVAQLLQETKVKKKGQVEMGRKKAPSGASVFNREHFGELSSKVNAKRKELEAAQLLNLSDAIDAGTVNRVRELSIELSQLEDVERCFYRQRAKVQWLNEADQSTKFFSFVVKVKSKRQAITSLLNEAGAPLDTQELISNEIVNFFSSLLGAKDPNVHCPPVSLLKDLISFSLPASEADLLTRDLTDEEIKQAIFGQDNDKSPRPDGYSAWFFKMGFDCIA